MIAMQGRAYGTGFWYTGNQFLYHFPVVLIEDGHCLQSGAQLSGTTDASQNFRITEPGQLTIPHLFKFCLHIILKGLFD